MRVPYGRDMNTDQTIAQDAIAAQFPTERIDPLWHGGVRVYATKGTRNATIHPTAEGFSVTLLIGDFYRDGADYKTPANAARRVKAWLAA